ncbi:MAG: TetR family transcriptional regulator [Anaerolineales bacterium]|nr:TetR/AcrR family transcriptional regulator [Anaerolineae bacterium]PWB50868.1 MAG: TetR family transcriptional regulator [Anaerolineales bacterium]
MTREGILEAAARIFSEKGFHATSMQDIAEAVNLQKASLYHHFASKQEILADILDEALDLINKNLEAVSSQALTPDEKLRQAMLSYFQTIAENKNLSAVLLLELRALDPEQKTRLAERREKFERLWRDLIIAGQREGVFGDVDPSLTGRAILGVMNWSVTWYRSDGPRSADEIANLFADLLLKGLVIQ